MLTMKQTTEAIVLGLRKHSDKLSVLHVYSRSEGRLALQLYGAHGKHKVRAAYQPLSVVELTYDSQPVRPVATIASIDPVYLPEQVYGDIRRQSIALFVTEIVMLTLTHPMQDERMYQFLGDFVRELNDASEPENMHIAFMSRLAELLGIGVPDLGTGTSLAGETEVAKPRSRAERKKQLQQLCNYYQEHVDTFRIPKSLDILIEIFD